MSKTQAKKIAAVEKLAKLEIALSKLIADHEAAAYRKNALVADSIDKAKKELMTALDLLLTNETEECLRSVGIAWLHLNFGRQLIDAETIEHLLGESDYLELTEAVVPPEVRIERYFSVLERDILKLRAVVRDQSRAS